MKNLITTTAIIFLLFDYSFAQAPDTIWTKTYGDSSHDASSSIIQTTDGSFIITGRIEQQFKQVSVGELEVSDSTLSRQV